MFFDSKGYAVEIVGDEVISYHPLMLRPFQGQTGCCIGAIFRKKSLEKRLQQVCAISAQELCDKVKWQDLAKFAKPYNDYFAVAKIEPAPVKSFFRGLCSYKAEPLYIGERCVAVRLPGKGLDAFEYISYAEYMEKL